jgi:hypothetical protein
MGIPKTCIYPSISVTAPNVASILPLGRLNLDDGDRNLAQQTRGFASKKVGNVTVTPVATLIGGVSIFFGSPLI